jgi:hypothetical protein
MLELAFALLMVAVLVAFADWRKGLFICVLTGLLQDPLRKLAPDQPAYFVLFAGLVFAAALAGAYLSHVRLGPRVIQGWGRYLRLPFGLFVAVIVLQGLHSLLRWGSPQMTGIGMMAYLLPVPAVVLAYKFALRGGLAGVRRLMWFYVIFVGIWLSSIYLDYLGFTWPVLGELGTGIIIYDVGMILKGYAGLFRATEIAAWHTGTTACFLFVLIRGRSLSLPKIALIIVCAAALVALGLLTGRRKVLVQIAIFASVYVFLIAWFMRGAAKFAVVALAAGFVAYTSIIGLMDADPGEKIFDSHGLQVRVDERYQAYVLRGQSVIDDVGDRFDQLGIQPVMWAVNGFGMFGAGLGTGSQGTQHVADAANVNRGAAEGGLGKITMELGVPGLLVALWLLVAFIRHIWRMLQGVVTISPLHANLAFGLVAFLIANVAAFSVAAQAFGDLFILMTLGWAIGFLLAMPVMAAAVVPDPRQRPAAGRLRAEPAIARGQPRFVSRTGR